MLRYALGVLLFAVLGPSHAAWTRQVKSSPMDGKQTATFEVRGAERVRDRFGRPSTPALVMRCSGGDVEVYFTAGMIMGGGSSGNSVRLRFDDQPAETVSGTRSTDYEALFFDWGKRIARKLLVTKQLLVEFTPFQMAPVVTRIDVAGLGRFASDLDRHCQLKSE